MARTTSRTSARPASEPNPVPADLERALLDLGVQVTGGDDNEVSGFCPVHTQRKGREQHAPKWSCNRMTGLWSCWTCQGSGNFLQLALTLRFKADMFEALRWIRGYGVALTPADELASWDELVTPVRADRTINEQRLAAFWQVAPEDELAARNLTRESADAHGVRWDGTQWVLPLRMRDGTLIGWQLKGGSDNRRYMRNHPVGVQKRLTLFGAHLFTPGTRAILVESPLDVVRLHGAGHEGGLATFGAQCSVEQMRMLASLTDEVTVAFDNDEAGTNAARLLANGDHTHPAYSRQFRLRVLAYDVCDTYRKDVGDMSDAEIGRALYYAKHVALAYPKESSSRSPASSGPSSKRRPTVVSRAARSSASSRKDRANRR